MPAQNRPSPLLLFPLTFLVALAGAGEPTPRANAHELILVRHTDKDPQRGDYNLSPAGSQRALKLARMLPACFGAPTEIITFMMNDRTSKNARSYQSAVPLAVATGVEIHLSRNSLPDSLGVGRRLRRRIAQGSTPQRFILFWEHRRMPELARGLGWPAMAPIGDHDFDQLFVFRYRTAQASPEVRQYSQNQLFRHTCSRQARLPWGATTAAPLEQGLP